MIQELLEKYPELKKHIKKIEKQSKFIMRLWDKDNFEAEFWRRAHDYETYEAAYESLERLMVASFGKRRYADYNSFKSARNAKKRKKTT